MIGPSLLDLSLKKGASNLKVKEDYVSVWRWLLAQSALWRWLLAQSALSVERPLASCFCLGLILVFSLLLLSSNSPRASPAPKAPLVYSKTKQAQSRLRRGGEDLRNERKYSIYPSMVVAIPFKLRNDQPYTRTTGSRSKDF